MRGSSVVGPQQITRRLSSLDTFFCLISSSVRDQICRFSNKNAEDFYQQWKPINPDKHPLLWTKITENEFTVFLGRLLVMGTQKSSKEKLSELWKQNAFPLYRATLSINCLQQLLLFIPFDNHRTRVARQSVDKAAPIRDILEMINSNLNTHLRKRSARIAIRAQI
ncbi:Transposase IS4 [Popillia japonica]|uniref:Transposase IS4 n=1 Tax=Popillia japonica TaxID=7064 RepID=A0AAW1JYK1_POPJA